MRVMSPCTLKLIHTHELHNAIYPVVRNDAVLRETSPFMQMPTAGIAFVHVHITRCIFTRTNRMWQTMARNCPHCALLSPLTVRMSSANATRHTLNSRRVMYCPVVLFAAMRGCKHCVTPPPVYRGTHACHNIVRLWRNVAIWRASFAYRLSC